MGLDNHSDGPRLRRRAAGHDRDGQKHPSTTGPSAWTLGDMASQTATHRLDALSTADAAPGAAAAAGRPIIRPAMSERSGPSSIAFATDWTSSSPVGFATPETLVRRLRTTSTCRSGKRRRCSAASIAHTSMLLDTALVVDEAELEGGVIALGSTVEVKDRDSRRRQRYRLTGGHEQLTLGIARPARRWAGRDGPGADGKTCRRHGRDRPARAAGNAGSRSSPLRRAKRGRSQRPDCLCQPGAARR